jgi:hypothetical protein
LSEEVEVLEVAQVVVSLAASERMGWTYWKERPSSKTEWTEWAGCPQSGQVGFVFFQSGRLNLSLVVGASINDAGIGYPLQYHHTEEDSTAHLGARIPLCYW